MLQGSAAEACATIDDADIRADIAWTCLLHVHHRLSARSSASRYELRRRIYNCADIVITMLSYGHVIVASWLFLMVVWVLGAFTAERNVSSKSSIVRWLWQLLLLGISIFALRNPQDDAYVLERGSFDPGPVVGWIGAFLTVVGVAFAIWARFSHSSAVH
jgi:hypothetical protein